MNSADEKVTEQEVLSWLHQRVSAETFRAVVAALYPKNAYDGRVFVMLLREAKIERQILDFLKKAMTRKTYEHFVRLAYLWETPNGPSDNI